MANLYEITKEMEMLDELLEFDDNGNLIDEEAVLELMEEVEKNFEQKVDGIVKYARNLNGKAEMINDEIKRLQAMKKVEMRKIERLTKYTKDMMDKLGIKKVETSIKKLSIRKGTTSYVLEDPRIVPKDLLKIEVSLKVNDAKKYIKANGAIPNGIREVQKDSTLKIV